MSLLCYAGFLAHGYYLAIDGCFLSYVLLVHALYHRKEKAVWRRSLAGGILVPVAAVALCLGTLKATDPWLGQRPPTANGYDNNMKVTPAALVTPYTFHSVQFPIRKSVLTDEPELAAYLGNVGLFAALGIAIGCIASGAFRRRFKATQRALFSNGFTGPLLVGGIVLFLMSCGHHFTTDDKDGFTIDNLLNPFYYLIQMVPQVRQFRSIERFIFPSYFVFYIWVAYTLAAIVVQERKPWRYVVLTGVIVLGGLEVKDYVHTIRERCGNENPLSAAAIAPLNSLPINYSEYQGVLTLPMYLVGAEDDGFTYVDDDDQWSRFTYQLNLKSGLPLLAIKLARTVPAHTTAKFDWIAKDSLWADTKALLNEKPILIVVNTKLAHDSAAAFLPPVGPRRDMYWRMNTFAERHRAEWVDSANGAVYYRWYPLRDSLVR